MEKRDKKDARPLSEEYEDEFYPIISNVVSAGECTGMMHAAPQNEEELESYRELYNMQIPPEKKQD